MRELYSNIIQYMTYTDNVPVWAIYLIIVGLATLSTILSIQRTRITYLKLDAADLNTLNERYSWQATRNEAEITRLKKLSKKREELLANCQKKIKGVEEVHKKQEKILEKPTAKIRKSRPSVE